MWCGCVAVWLCGCVVVWRVTVKEEVSEFHARRRHIRLYRLHLSLLCPHGAVIRSQDALSQRKRGSAVVSAVIPLNQHSLFRIDRQYDEQHFHTQRAIENYCLIILSPPPPKKRKASGPSGNYRLVIHSHEKTHSPKGKGGRRWFPLSSLLTSTRSFESTGNTTNNTFTPNGPSKTIA